MIGKLIGLVLACVLIGAVAGTAVTAIVNVNTGTWGSAAPLWLILPIVVVIAFVILLLKEAGVEF
jgi:hypothetical protein